MHDEHEVRRLEAEAPGRRRIRSVAAEREPERVVERVALGENLAEALATEMARGPLVRAVRDARQPRHEDATDLLGERLPEIEAPEPRLDVVDRYAERREHRRAHQRRDGVAVDDRLRGLAAASAAVSIERTTQLADAAGAGTHEERREPGGARRDRPCREDHVGPADVGELPQLGAAQIVLPRGHHDEVASPTLHLTDHGRNLHQLGGGAYEERDHRGGIEPFSSAVRCGVLRVARTTKSGRPRTSSWMRAM